MGSLEAGSGEARVECPACFLRQVRTEAGRCRRCGSALTGGEAPGIGAAVPSAPEPAAARGPAAPRPGAASARPAAQPPAANDRILDLAVDVEEEDRERRVRSNQKMDAMTAQVAGGGSGGPPAVEAPRGPGLGKRLAALPGLALAGLRRVRAGLSRLSTLPRWAKWELGIGVVLFVLVVGALLLQPRTEVSGEHRSTALGLALAFPEEGWHRFPVEIEGGPAETFRTAPLLAEATTALWVRTIALSPLQNPYRPVGGSGAVDEPLDPDFLAMDSGELLAKATAAVLEARFEVREQRGCLIESVGGHRGPRCRYLAGLGEQEWELELFAFGTSARLVLALLATRVPVDPAVFEEGLAIVTSSRLL